jgi:hypothetical protein
VKQYDKAFFVKKYMTTKQFILLSLGILCLAISLKASPGKKLSRKYKKIQKFIDQATSTKLAGVCIYIQSPKHGEWTTTSGYANLERKELLQADQFFSLASIGKMYNAVGCFKISGRRKNSIEWKNIKLSSCGNY